MTRTTTKVPLVAQMEDGNNLSVVADMRDFAKWEIQPEAGLPNPATFTRSRFLAWSAARRAKLYAGSWMEFNEQDCVEVSSPDDDKPQDGDGLDPTQPAPGATT